MQNKNLHLAKKLRKNQTDEEIKLWNYLRSRRFSNIKFRRQVPLGDYIVDFCCFEKKLIIELDGSGHGHPLQEDKDRIRDGFLKETGFTVLRIQNFEMKKNFENVIDKIFELINNTPHP